MPSGSGRFIYNGNIKEHVIPLQTHIDEENTYLNLIEMVSPEKDCIEAFNIMRAMRDVESPEYTYEEQRTLRQGLHPEGDENHGDLLEDFFGKRE